MVKKILLLIFFNVLFSTLSFGLSDTDKKICNAYHYLSEKNKCIEELTAKEDQETQEKLAAEEKRKEALQPPKVTAMKKVHASVHLTKNDFSIVEASIIITNESNYNVKDIEITCLGFAESGTRLDTNTQVIYKIFMANHVTTIANFNMGFMRSQTTKYECYISNLEVI